MALDEGIIVQIIGPVIDVKFENGVLPEIYDALEIYNENGEKTVAEVQQLLGENTVRSVAMTKDKKQLLKFNNYLVKTQ